MTSLESTSNAAPLGATFMQMVTGYWVSQSIYVAAKLKIADLLVSGDRSCVSLSELTQTDSRSLYRLLRGLASVGIFAEIDNGTFTLTPLANLLRSDIPNSLRAMAMLHGEEHYPSWGNLLHSIQTGESAFEQLYSMNLFQYYAENAKAARIYDEAMTSYSSIEIASILAHYDFSGFQTIAEIAGGHGSLLLTILQTYPHLQGILFDQPTVIEGATQKLKNHPAVDRCKLVSGDFFQTMPKDADVYLFKYIIHAWDDEHSIAILQQCRAAMSEQSKLLLLEQVIPPGNDPFAGKFLDLNMLVMYTGGQERTESEYATLLDRAGFKLTQAITTTSPTAISIVEAVPL